jgi:hypothetical protein
MNRRVATETRHACNGQSTSRPVTVFFPSQIQSHISGIINDEKVYGREEVLWGDIPPFLAGHVQFILIFSLITTLETERIYPKHPYYRQRTWGIGTIGTVLMRMH